MLSFLTGRRVYVDSIPFYCGHYYGDSVLHFELPKSYPWFDFPDGEENREWIYSALWALVEANRTEILIGKLFYVFSCFDLLAKKSFNKDEKDTQFDELKGTLIKVVNDFCTSQEDSDKVVGKINSVFLPSATDFCLQFFHKVGFIDVGDDQVRKHVQRINKQRNNVVHGSTIQRGIDFEKDIDEAFFIFQLVQRICEVYLLKYLNLSVNYPNDLKRMEESIRALIRERK